MFIFLYMLAALGVAYAAKLNGRAPFPWFLLSAVTTPLGGGLALSFANRYGWFRG